MVNLSLSLRMGTTVRDAVAFIAFVSNNRCNLVAFFFAGKNGLSERAGLAVGGT
jgi:hypothetical protein